MGTLLWSISEFIGCPSFVLSILKEDVICGRDIYNFYLNPLRVELSYFHLLVDHSLHRVAIIVVTGSGRGRKKWISIRYRYSVSVTGLLSWDSLQDLKDHMWQVVAIYYSEVFCGFFFRLLCRLRASQCKSWSSMSSFRRLWWVGRVSQV